MWTRLKPVSRRGVHIVFTRTKKCLWTKNNNDNVFGLNFSFFSLRTQPVFFQLFFLPFSRFKTNSNWIMWWVFFTWKRNQALKWTKHPSTRNQKPNTIHCNHTSFWCIFCSFHLDIKFICLLFAKAFAVQCTSWIFSPQTIFQWVQRYWLDLGKYNLH